MQQLPACPDVSGKDPMVKLFVATPQQTTPSILILFHFNTDKLTVIGRQLPQNQYFRDVLQRILLVKKSGGLDRTLAALR
jgi:hypothetical protein